MKQYNEGSHNIYDIETITFHKKKKERKRKKFKITEKKGHYSIIQKEKLR